MLCCISCRSLDRTKELISVLLLFSNDAHKNKHNLRRKSVSKMETVKNRFLNEQINMQIRRSHPFPSTAALTQLFSKLFLYYLYIPHVHRHSSLLYLSCSLRIYDTSDSKYCSLTVFFL